ncbi:hypothetical protein ABPG77_009296 [Micractinium sp. CCAP 211/92]
MQQKGRRHGGRSKCLCLGQAKSTAALLRQEVFQPLLQLVPHQQPLNAVYRLALLEKHQRGERCATLGAAGRNGRTPSQAARTPWSCNSDRPDLPGPPPPGLPPILYFEATLWYFSVSTCSRSSGST